jgi:3-dehydroquinate synthase
LCERAELPVQAPPLSVLPIARWMALMQVDKKSEAGALRFVVIDSLGRAAVRAAPDALVAEVIAAHSAAD